MQVVLKKRVPKLGNENDVVNVKVGYARNFLFPQSLAIPATKQALTHAETLKVKMVQKMETILENAKEIADKLKGLTITFKKKARDEKLYGSIKEADVVDALVSQHKLELKKEMVKMDEHLKTLGEHTVKIELTEAISAELKVIIEAE
ncbi:50S ribosomal protein L9 [Candidatus Pacearchaeota archaeon]|nr:50S ribosomal protein L9 [Candidatus Pacearchaeota archaeon]